jgi:hypothetical protein
VVVAAVVGLTVVALDTLTAIGSCTIGAGAAVAVASCQSNRAVMVMVLVIHLPRRMGSLVVHVPVRVHISGKYKAAMERMFPFGGRSPFSLLRELMGASFTERDAAAVRLVRLDTLSGSQTHDSIPQREQMFEISRPRVRD